MASRDTLRFLLGTKLREIKAMEPTTSVLDHLRLVEGRTGTKEGCAEGDCGACSVVVARPGEGNHLSYRAVNACIQPLGTLDGCQLITVEDLAAADGTLHPVQQAMVDAHGSQCGFCTPGFVMSLFAMTKSDVATPDDQDIDEALAGNLCRCTGYAPIARAARDLADAPAPDHFDLAQSQTLTRLRAMDDGANLSLSDGKGRHFFAPATGDELADILVDHPQATIVAGATDVGLWFTKHLKRPTPLVWIGRVADLARIEETPTAIEIGAGVTYSDALETLARLWPDFGAVLRRLGSTQIRNAGTIGGNVANGSPIGDTPPMLIALGARLHLRAGATRRVLPIEDFFIDYGKQDRALSEFVEKISIPRPHPETVFKAYKISKRFDQDISAVLGAFSLTFDHDRIVAARIAYGGMAGTPKRSPSAEAALTGKQLDRAAIEAAMEALTVDFTPLTDMRASASYRMAVARNLLLRLLAEAGDSGVETRLWDKREVSHDHA